MNKYHFLALISLILAFIFFGLSIAAGEDSVYVFIVIPVFQINSILSGLGALFLFLTFIFYFLGFTYGFELVGWDEFQDELKGGTQSGERQSKSNAGRSRKTAGIRGSGVVLIGPVPIIFGSDQKLTLITVVLALVIMVVAFLFFFMM